MSIVCGIDNGTQSTKVLVYDSDRKQVLALSHAPHGLIQKPDGSREQEASWWIDALRHCFEEIDPALRGRIEAVGVSGQQHGFVPLDGEGNVLAPVKLWCDTSTQEECDELTAKLGGPHALIALTGNEVKVGFTASKVLAFKHHQPSLYRRMDRFLLPHDYLNFILTGKATMEWGDASGTAMFDVVKRTWSRPVLEAIDPDRDWSRTLPPLVERQAGTVCVHAARLFGIPEGIPVSQGGGDNMMSAIGTGTVENGTLTMSLGTSGTLFGYSDTPVVDPEGRLSAFCSSSGGWLPLLCTMNCTVSSELTRNLLGCSVGGLNELAAEAPIGAQGVLTLPFFNGERTPDYPRGKGTIFGLDGTNYTRPNLARSAMEASIYGLRLGLDAFVSLGFRPASLTLVGGGAKSALWRRMAADVMGLEVRIPREEEAAAFGGALQALSLLLHRSVSAVCREHVGFRDGEGCLPDARRHEAYEAVYRKWSDLVAFVAPLYRSGGGM